MNITQVGLAVFGVIAIYLVNSKGPYQKYGCLFGLAGQPFWFWSAYQAQQYGVLLLCCFYTFSWAQGVDYKWLT
jgi:hypothetical protein